MLARVGITDSGREIETTIESRDSFVERIEAAYANGDALIWLTDTKGNEVGVVTSKIAYIEIADTDSSAVGFSR